MLPPPLLCWSRLVLSLGASLCVCVWAARLRHKQKSSKLPAMEKKGNLHQQPRQGAPISANMHCGEPARKLLRALGINAAEPSIVYVSILPSSCSALNHSKLHYTTVHKLTAHPPTHALDHRRSYNLHLPQVLQ